MDKYLSAGKQEGEVELAEGSQGQSSRPKHGVTSHDRHHFRIFPS
jgi:hypothetical protein